MGKKSQTVPKITVQVSDSNYKLKPEKIDLLKDLYLMNGITSYRASLVAGVSHKTAQKYFEEFAEQIVQEEESTPYENWIQRQRRIRSRALEGIAVQMAPIQQRILYFERMVANLLLKKTRGKKTLPGNNFEVKNLNDLQHVLIEKYDNMIRQNAIMLNALKQEYNEIEMMLPPEAVIDREIELALESKIKNISTK